MASSNFVYRYVVEKNHEKFLYVNLTNRCTNRCSFCIRNSAEGVGNNTDLWLTHEPSAEEVIAALKKEDISSFEEIVFCGYGEPTIRIDPLLKISKWLKDNYACSIRINTNGQGSKFHNRDITPDMEGLIDTLSISLNASNAASYQQTCHSIYGEEAYDILLDFAKKAKMHVPNVILSIVDILPETEIAACRKVAQSVGCKLKVREYIDNEA